MTDLHTRLRSAVEARLALAQAAQGSGERLSLSWPRAHGKTALAAFFNAADPIAFVIRACQADLDRLNEHTPVLSNIDDPPGYAHLCRRCFGHPPWPCSEISRLAEVYQIERDP